MGKLQRKQPDIQFNLEEIATDDYKVTSQHFPTTKGIGKTPEQALDDLISKISVEFEEISREILVTTMHKEEILQKYQKSFARIKIVTDKRNIAIKIFDKVLYTLKLKKNNLKIKVFLKEKTSIDSLLQKVGENLSSKKLGKDKFFKNNLPKTITSKIPPHPGIIFHDEAMLINTSPVQKEIPIQLFLDEEGNTLDDVFPYGIVVNLN